MIVETLDGSQTLRHETLGELYHSDRGALGESLYIYIECGLGYALSQPIEQSERTLRVFEVGFGSGLNAMLTMQRSREVGPIEYHAIELYPLSPDTYLNLMYARQEPSFIRLHESPWEQPTEIEPNFRLAKYKVALEDLDRSIFTGRLLDFAQRFDVIYFDAFSPEVQPHLWTVQIMRTMYEILKPSGVLVTYSAKGVVKQALRDVGFSVVRLKGAMGKRHMVRASKI